MPGSKNLNIRATEEQIERLKAGATALGMSVTKMVMLAALHVADGAIAGKTEQVHTKAPVQEVSEKLRQAPSEVQEGADPQKQETLEEALDALHVDPAWLSLRSRPRRETEERLRAKFGVSDASAEVRPPGRPR